MSVGVLTRVTKVPSEWSIPRSRQEAAAKKKNANHCERCWPVYSHSCVCFFLFQSPPKGATIPYRPKPQVGGPLILAGGQAYTIQGNYAVPAHSDVSTVLPLPAPAAGPTPPSLNTQTLTTSPFAAHPSSSAFAASHGHPLLSTAHLTTPHHPLHPSPLHASVAGLADPLLKSGHLQAALPPAHLVADAVSLLFFVIHPSSRTTWDTTTRPETGTHIDTPYISVYKKNRADCTRDTKRASGPVTTFQ